jgi:hypothetical protein
MRDNEDSTATLRDSEVLSVQHSVGEPIPEFSKRPEKGTKVPPSVATEDTRHIFPDNPSGLEAISQSKKDEGEVAACVFKSLAEASDGEGLTGGSSDQKVD